MSKKILIVDDEKDIVKLLSDYFSFTGYIVLTAYDGEEAIQKSSKNPDIILLDINMPKMNGFEVCKKIREFVICPIVFLTAKVEERDIINGLMIGGDDYILKPFNIDELAARVEAHLRRENRSLLKTEVKFNNDFVINYTSREIFFKNEKVNLTKIEFDLVEFLSMHRGQVFDKEHIYESVWSYDSDGDSNIITEHIRRIRQKISKYTDINYIETVWGVGYKWIQ